jgi:putative acetyltransferase
VLAIRPIAKLDDLAVASLIRTVMPEFGAKGPGFAINDPEVDHMTEAYSDPRSRYWVVEDSGRIVGGGGFAQLLGADADTCELRKMYFLSEARGTGLGKQLLELCMAEAKRVGYTRMYLETLENMHAARRLYAAFGFQPLPKPKGATGHFGCDAWYERAL